MAMDVDEEEGSSSRQQMLGRTLLEVEEDWEVQEPSADFRAGEIKPMDPGLLWEWKERFGRVTEEERQKENPLGIFTSRLDWEIGNWAIRDSASNSAFDRLLAIPEVSIIVDNITTCLINQIKGQRTIGFIIQEYARTSSESGFSSRTCRCLEREVVILSRQNRQRFHYTIP